MNNQKRIKELEKELRRLKKIEAQNKAKARRSQQVYVETEYVLYNKNTKEYGKSKSYRHYQLPSGKRNLSGDDLKNVKAAVKSDIEKYIRSRGSRYRFVRMNKPKITHRVNDIKPTNIKMRKMTLKRKFFYFIYHIIVKYLPRTYMHYEFSLKKIKKGIECKVTK